MRFAPILLVAVACGGAACNKAPDGPEDGIAVANRLGLKMDPQAATAACASPEVQAQDPHSLPLEQRQQIIGCINEQAARQIRPSLPLQIDPVTKLVAIDAEGAVLTYTNRVESARDQLPANVGELLERQVRTTACGSPQMRQTIELGGAYRWRWNDQSGHEIHSAQIDHC
jgi:hypothetical protein